MIKYILDQLDGDDKLLKFNEIVPKNYDIDIDIINDLGLGSTELLVYSFLYANAFEYWDEDIDPDYPAGDIYIQMGLHDFVSVTGCNVQDVRNALETLNHDGFVRVVEINTDYGKRYAYHATT